MKNILLLFCLALFSPLVLRAQCIQPYMDLPDVSGQVNVITPSQTGDTLYVGGNFTAISPKITGALALIAKQGFSYTDKMPIFGNTIYAITGDGHGGWYVAGNFVKVYPSTNQYYVARVRADGSLHPFSVQVDDMIKTLQFSGDRLFMGGDFTSVNNTARNYIAAVDTNGALINWAPNLNGEVNAMHWYNGKLYVGGMFTTAGGLPRQRVAAFDTINSVPSSLSFTINNAVGTLQADDSLLYIGGAFTSVNSSTRNYLAVLRLSSNTLHPYSTSFTGYSVNSLLLHNNRLLIAGNFTFAGGQARSSFAALNRITATVLPTSVTLTTNSGGINGYALYRADSMILFGGEFGFVNGQPRRNFAVLDTGSLSLMSYKLAFNKSPLAFGSNGTSILVGGDFNAINTINKKSFFAYRVSTNEVLPDSINFGGSSATVSSIGLYNNKLILGGFFDTLNGLYRKNLAMVSLNGNVAPLNLPADGEVRKIAVSQATVFIAGTFSNVGGQSRLRLAAFDADGGALLSFAPNPNNAVNDILLSGNRLFVGGNFSQVNAVARNRFASFAISGNNLTLQAWSLPVSNQQTVKQLAMNNGMLYAMTDTSYANTYGMILMADTTNAAARPYKTLKFMSDNLRQLTSMTFYDSLVMYTFSYNTGQYNTYAEIIEPDGNAIGSMMIAGYSTLIAKHIGNRIYFYGNVTHQWNIYGNYISYYDLNNRPQVSVSKTQFCVGDTLLVSSSAATGNRWWNNDTNATLNYIVPNQSLIRLYTFAPMPGCSLALSQPKYYSPFQQPGTNTIVVSKNPFCAEDTVTLSLSTAPTPGNTFKWSGNDTASAIQVTHAGVYQLTISNATCKRIITPVTLTTYPVPAKPMLSVTDTLLRICSDTQVSITVSGGSAPYHWSDNSTGSSLVTNVSGNYTAYYNSVQGCRSELSKAVNVHVDSMPEITWIEFVTRQDVCGATDSLQIQALVGKTGSLFWNNGSVGHKTIYARLADKQVYVVNKNGLCNRISNTIDIVDAAPAKPNITADKTTSFCQGGSVKLTSDWPLTNAWSNGANTRFITVTASGRFTVKAINNGCASVPSDTLTVTVFPKPATPVITRSGDTLYINQAGTITWYANATQVAITTKKYYLPTGNGTYYARIQDANSCISDYSNNIVFVRSGMDETAGNIFMAYPNPAEKTFTISAGIALDVVSIYTSEGALIKEADANGSTALTINIADLAPGMYIVMVHAGSETKPLRLIKQ